MTKRLLEVEEEASSCPELLPELWALIWTQVAVTPLEALRVAAISRETWSLLAPTLRRHLRTGHWNRWHAVAVKGVMKDHPRRYGAWESLLRDNKDDDATLLHMIRLLALCWRQKSHRKRGRAYWDAGHQSLKPDVSLKLHKNFGLLGIRSFFYVGADGQAHPLHTYEPLRIQCDSALEGLAPFRSLVAEAQKLAEAMDPVSRALALQRLAKGGRKRWGLMCDLLGVERMPTRPASEEPDYLLGTAVIGDTHFYSVLHDLRLPFALHWYRRNPPDPLAATVHLETAQELTARVKALSRTLKTLANVEKLPKIRRDPQVHHRMLQVQIMGFGLG